MSKAWLDLEQLDAYRTIPFANYEGKTHDKDGQEWTVSNALHALVKILILNPPDSPIFNQEVVKELNPEDMQDRIKRYGEIESYLDTYGTDRADTSVTLIPKPLIKGTLAGIHQWLDEKNPVGKYNREAIAKAMDVLGLGSPERGKHTSDLSSPPEPDNLPPRG